MASAEVWLVILGGMIATYAIRLSFVALIPSDRLPAFFRRGLSYIPPAVLAAILLPEIVFQSGSFDISPQNHRLLAGLVAAFVGWRLKNTWITIATGMVALWLLTFS